MKIAFTAKGTDWQDQIDPRFGRCAYLVFYDEDTDTIDWIDNGSSAGIDHGAGPQTAQKLLTRKPDILITGNGPGGNASRVLSYSQITVYTGAADKSLQEAYQDFKNNRLTEFKF
ncbi:MAG: dinitrogenase iron-molybdenum cofactor biosynthesis protein [Candidatus Cloacimonetes bacterium]|nr:dinitrogenase iron-molybdenum cofactor biosynthesis protein [Candidatus Cloacimonadota bacterium]